MPNWDHCSIQYAMGRKSSLSAIAQVPDHCGARGWAPRPGNVELITSELQTAGPSSIMSEELPGFSCSTHPHKSPRLPDSRNSC